MALIIDKNTILKYDVPGPRYTSYPTAPVWSDQVSQGTYIQKLKDFGRNDRTLSLYIHIPFCQTLCSYCGCNVVIRRKDERYGDEYLDYLFKEIALISQFIGNKKEIKQLHWGGGTPTFLNEKQIERLFKNIEENFKIDSHGEIAVEVDPRTIDKAKLKKLRTLGFNRISMGIQDFDEKVQKGVNRIQPYETVKEFYDWCRELKYHSINFDLIYGLPYQTPKTFQDTIDKVIFLKPDRIALYNFAYVPWLKKHQNKIDEKYLPTNEQKIEIFLNSREQFLKNGYQAIAMDHFALKGDELAKAFKKGELYRNFMGYTVKPADEYIGLGLTSISFLENSFFQNHKILKKYYTSLEENQLPTERGVVLSQDDQMRQWIIHSLMCQFKIDKTEFRKKFNSDFDHYFKEEQTHLRQCLAENLITVEKNTMKVSELGKIFIRNICMGFDWYLKQKETYRNFSKTV